MFNKYTTYFPIEKKIFFKFISINFQFFFLLDWEFWQPGYIFRNFLIKMQYVINLILFQIKWFLIFLFKKTLMFSWNHLNKIFYYICFLKPILNKKLSFYLDIDWIELNIFIDTVKVYSSDLNNVTKPQTQPQTLRN